MAYKKKITLLVLVHSLWLALLLISLPLAILYDGYKAFALGIVAVNFLVWAVGGDCFLSAWERDLRKRHDPQSSYDRTFAGHYLSRTVGIRVSDTFINIVIFLFFSILTYVSIFYVIVTH